MHVGDRVEVHCRFDGSWCSGFEIAQVVSGGYRVRRLSDGSLLPGFTSYADLRPDGSIDVAQRARSRPEIVSR